MESNPTVVIIGLGLVGPVCALLMARRGFRVTIYEYREDPRTINTMKGRAINITLSNRARKVLRKLGIEDEILKLSVPIKGRYIHNLVAKNKSIVYDKRTEQCLYSVSRNCLNCQLVNVVESETNIKIHFNYKLIEADLKKNTLTVLHTLTGTTIQVAADLIVGADGAFSTLRKIMQQTPLYSFSQIYINHGYIEMKISAGNGSSLIANHLHIWPRKEFMMMALPNNDGSWTATLFMPFEKFKELTVEYFREVFPDVINLIPESRLETYLMQKPFPLVSIKCSRLHTEAAVVIGDAAHAMVPFYGQGLNTGLEDCLILDSIIQDHQNNFKLALSKFTKVRCDDAHAICDLAMYNYTEMRDLVTHTSYSVRKFFDDVMFSIVPKHWIPLYYSVTFSEMNYRQCVKNRSWQNKVLRNFGIFLILLGFTLIYWNSKVIGLKTIAN